MKTLKEFLNITESKRVVSKKKLRNMIENNEDIKDVGLQDKDIGYMFNSSKIKIVPLFDTSKVTDMHGMFTDCTELEHIPLFNTSKVTDMRHMFYGCTELETVPNFDTKNVSDMRLMFSNCKSLEYVPLFDTKNVVNARSMFYNCNELKEVPQFDTRSVTDMRLMFSGCIKLKEIPKLDTKSVTIMHYIFDKCKDTLVKISPIIFWKIPEEYQNIFDYKPLDDLINKYKNRPQDIIKFIKELKALDPKYS